MPLNPVKTTAFIALSILLGACASTKPIDPGRLDLVAPAAAAEGEDVNGVTQTYSDDVAGKIEDLYGDDVTIETSEAYKRAVEENSALAYNVIYFDFDSTEISEEARELIKSHVDYLIENSDVFVILEGHTDKRGSEGYNLALGDRRAAVVKALFIGFGLSESQLSSVSFGEEKLAVSGDSDVAHDKNRRVEIVYQ